MNKKVSGLPTKAEEGEAFSIYNSRPLYSLYLINYIIYLIIYIGYFSFLSPFNISCHPLHLSRSIADHMPMDNTKLSPNTQYIHIYRQTRTKPGTALQTPLHYAEVPL